MPSSNGTTSGVQCRWNMSLQIPPHSGARHQGHRHPAAGPVPAQAVKERSMLPRPACRHHPRISRCPVILQSPPTHMARRRLRRGDRQVLIAIRTRPPPPSGVGAKQLSRQFRARLLRGPQPAGPCSRPSPTGAQLQGTELHTANQCLPRSQIQMRTGGFSNPQEEAAAMEFPHPHLSLRARTMAGPA
jgi:hypothetical protein